MRGTDGEYKLIGKLSSRDSILELWVAERMDYSNRRVLLFKPKSGISVKESDLLKLYERINVWRQMNKISLPIREVTLVESSSYFIIVTDFYKVTPLSALIEKDNLDAETFLDLVVKVAKLVSDAHKIGIYHTTLTPDSILVDEKFDVKLVDWGISFLLYSNVRHISSFSGLKIFLAPEQVNVLNGLSDNIDWRTDIWQLGAIVNMFFRNNIRSTMALSTIRQILTVAEIALAQDKNYRWQSVEDFIDALSSSLRNEVVREPCLLKYPSISQGLKAKLLLCIILFPELKFLAPYTGVNEKIISYIQDLANKQKIEQVLHILSIISGGNLQLEDINVLFKDKLARLSFLEHVIASLPLLPFHKARNLMIELANNGLYVPIEAFFEIFNSGKIDRNALSKSVAKIIKRHPNFTKIIPPELLLNNLNLLSDDAILSIPTKFIIEIYKHLKERYKNIWPNIADKITPSTANNIIILSLLEENTEDAIVFLSNYYKTLVSLASEPFRQVVLSLIDFGTLDKIDENLALKIKEDLPPDALYRIFVSYRPKWIKIRDIIPAIKNNNSRITNIINIIESGSYPYSLEDLIALYPLLKKHEDKELIFNAAVRINAAKEFLNSTQEFHLIITNPKMDADTKLQLTKEKHNIFIKENPHEFLNIWWKSKDKSIVDKNLIMTLYGYLKNSQDKEKCLVIANMLGMLSALLNKYKDWELVIKSQKIGAYDKLKALEPFYGLIFEKDKGFLWNEIRKLPVNRKTFHGLQKLFRFLIEKNPEQMYNFLMKIEDKSVIDISLLFSLYLKMKDIGKKATILKNIIKYNPQYISKHKVGIKELIIAKYRLGDNVCNLLKTMNLADWAVDSELLYIASDCCFNIIEKSLDKLPFPSLVFISNLVGSDKRKLIFRALLEHDDPLTLVSLVMIGGYYDDLKRVLTKNFISQMQSSENVGSLVTALILTGREDMIPIDIQKRLAEEYPDIVFNIENMSDEAKIIAATILLVENVDKNKVLNYIIKLLNSKPKLLRPYLVTIFMQDKNLAWDGLFYGSFVSATAIFTLAETINSKRLVKMLKKVKGKLPIAVIDDIIDGLKKGKDIRSIFKELGLYIPEKKEIVRKKESLLKSEYLLAIRSYLQNKQLKIFLSEIINKMTGNIHLKRKLIKIAEYEENQAHLALKVIRLFSTVYDADSALKYNVIDKLFTYYNHILNSIDKHQSKDIQRVMVETISYIFKGSGREVEALNVLKNVFRNPNWHVRSITAKVIGRIFKDSGKEMEALKILSFLLKNTDWRVRSSAVEAINYIFEDSNNMRIFNVLKPLLKDYDWRVRNAAAKALGDIFKNSYCKDVSDELNQLLKDSNPQVRNTVKNAINKIMSDRQ